MTSNLGSIRLIKDASDTTNMGTVNCGSVYLKPRRIEETFGRETEAAPAAVAGYDSNTQLNSSAPFFAVSTNITRSWNITGLLSGSPDAYIDLNRIGSMCRFGKLAMLIVDYGVGAGGIGSHLVEINRFQPVAREGFENTFDYTMLLIAGSILK